MGTRLVLRIDFDTRKRLGPGKSNGGGATLTPLGERMVALYRFRAVVAQSEHSVVMTLAPVTG